MPAYSLICNRLPRIENEDKMTNIGKEHWYALYVRMHHEKKTAEILQQLGCQCFLPVQEVVRQWSDRKKKVKVIVIPMIVFVRCTEKRRVELLNILPSVVGTLMDRCTKKPAIIRDEEMNTFMFMLDSCEGAVNFSESDLVKGEIVEVVKGPLKGLKGELIEVEKKSQVQVRIDCLGVASVEVPIECLKKVDR